VDDASSPGHSTGQGDRELPPTEFSLIMVLRQPDLFAALVEYLEPSPVSWLLKLWGVAHGVYPADRLAPAPVEDLRALLNRLS
jgi:hypothetical protein